MRIRIRFCSVCRRTTIMNQLVRASKNYFRMIYKIWSQECTSRALGMNYHKPEAFTRCMWQKSKRVLPLWIAYRAFAAGYFIFSFIYTAFPIGKDVPEEKTLKYIIFLTHWTYVLETTLFVLALIIVAIRAYEENKKAYQPMEEMPWYYKMYWIFYTITLPSSITVTVVFWATIYDPVLFPANAGNLIEHAFNSTFMLIDFFLIAHPIRFLHFYLPAVYAFLYGGFSLVYQLSGGTGVKGIIPIYKILDWREPDRAVLTCFLTLTFLLCLHFLFSLLHMLKAYCKKKEPEEQNE